MLLFFMTTSKLDSPEHSNSKQLTSRYKANAGFTIVELLVVIVIIGILAAISIVSYTGISTKANVTALTSDLASAKKQFALYYTEHGVYPTNLDNNNCPTGSTSPSPDTNYCLKPSSGNKFSILDTNGITYTLTATRGSLDYKVTESTTPIVTVSNWITIGSQTWSKKNLNIGTMIDVATTQTGNSTIEKYCYNGLESNCTAYGALYQWDEAMQYIKTAGAQGICPAGSHIPSDNEWKTLEMSLSGMLQATADITGWRGTDEGTKLKSSTPPGLNMPIAGNRYIDGSFSLLSSSAFLWSSSESNISAWSRHLYSGYTTVHRLTYSKSFGFSVRCLGD